MKVIVENLAKICLDDIFQYNIQYSLKNALETDIGISQCFYDLSSSPYIGKNISKIPDKHFRKFIYNKLRNSYRIIYYISNNKSYIYIIHISNCKQDFNRILKLHNYFNNYFDF